MIPADNCDIFPDFPSLPKLLLDESFTLSSETEDSNTSFVWVEAQNQQQTKQKKQV